MSVLRIAAVLVVLALASVSAAFCQTAPGAGGGNYDGHSSSTTSTATPKAMTTTAPQATNWASTIVFRSFALSAGGWWTSPAVWAPVVASAPRVQTTTVSKATVRR